MKVIELRVVAFDDVTTKQLVERVAHLSEVEGVVALEPDGFGRLLPSLVPDHNLHFGLSPEYTAKIIHAFRTGEVLQ